MAMDIARTKEATVNDMKSLQKQGASARPHDTNIDAVKQNSKPKCGKCGKFPAQGTRCRKCNQWNHWEQVCRNKQTQDWRAKPSPRKQPEGWIPQKKTRCMLLERQSLTLMSCVLRQFTLTLPILIC